MPEIFERTATALNGVFSADTGRLAFAGGVTSTLVQNLNATYTQSVVRLYEIGNINQQISNIYYVGGRSAGQAGIGRIVGPSALLGAFYQKFGNVCNAATNGISFTLQQADCRPNGANAQVSYNCKFCVITQIGFGVQAMDMLINENSAIMFSGLEYTEGGA